MQREFKVHGNKKQCNYLIALFYKHVLREVIVLLRSVVDTVSEFEK